MSSAAKAGKVKQALDGDVKTDIRAIKEGSRKELSPVAARYLRNLANPAGSSLGGIPTLLGGNGGRSDVRRFRAKGTFQPGVLGFGFCAIAPMPVFTPGRNYNGPTFPLCSNSVFGSKSDNSWAGAAMPNPYDLLTSHPGVSNITFADSDLTYQQVGTAANGATFDKAVGYRCVGACIEIFCEASFSTSSGEITLLEMPGHICPQGSATPAGGGLTYDKIASNSHARTIRATQTSSQQEKIVLNFHPRMASPHYGVQFEGVNDFAYQYPSQDNGIQPSTSHVQPWSLVVAVSGIAFPLTFHYTVTVIYEVIGSNIQGKVRPVDSRGMDLVHNVLMSKNLSGYVGKPEQIEESYLHQAWKHATKSLGGMITGKAKGLLESAATHGLEALGGFL